MLAIMSLGDEVGTLTTKVMCMGSNLWGPKNTFDESYRRLTPLMESMGFVRPWLIFVLRNIFLVFPSPTFMPVTTITSAQEIESNTLRFRWKDACAMPL